MRDPRHDELAKVLVRHSTRAKPGEVAMINGVGFETYPLVRAIARELIAAGAIPLLRMEDNDSLGELIATASEEQFRKLGEVLLAEMKQAQIYIGIRGTRNAFELAEAPRARLDLYNKYIAKPVHMEQRVKHSRWVVLRYPNPAMAQLANRSTDAFEDYYFQVCTVNYARMAEAAKPLAELMRKTDRVRITAPGTDLSFSIKGIGVIPCCGEMNIPDGECFTAPVRDSLEGVVQFNTPTLTEGRAFDRIRLKFEKGKVVEAEDGGGNTAELNRILDRDEGARYIGEFAIGFHPVIKKPMRDILFDEKIGGSWHMALGNAYDDANNGNKSALHWDLVQIQRSDVGGGTIEFDGRIIRQDGVFTLPELKGLNPENLTL